MRYQAALRPDCSTNTADKSKFKGYNSYKILINLIFNAIRDLMIIECPICNKKFNLNEKLLPKNGRLLKCSSCEHIWHYKTSLGDKIDEVKLFQKKEIGSEVAPKIEKKNVENNQQIINEIASKVGKNNLTDKKDNSFKILNEKKKKIDNKEPKIKMILSNFLIIIISLIGIIFLIDTFKVYISSYFPSISPLLDSFYETLLDLKLFFKDLTN